MSTTPYVGAFSDKQQQELLDLLWEFLTEDRENDERVYTGYGTKTKTGLLACIERIVLHDESFNKYEQ